MDGLSEEFFSCSGFTGDEDIGITSSCLGNEFHTDSHYRTTADDTFTLQYEGCLFLFFCFSVLEGTHQRKLYQVSFQRFFNEIPGSVLYRKLSAIRASKPCYDD